MESHKTPLRTELLLELAGIIVLICFIGSELNLLRDPGVGWHLRTGEWIATHHAIPATDPFLFTSTGKSWICNQWLADLFFWGMFRLGGFASVQAAAILICILPILILLPKRLRHFGASAPTMVFTELGCMGLGLIQWYVRPVIFSFLLFGVVYSVLWSRSRYLNWRRSDFLFFPALFLLWANLHPGFPLGLFLIGAALWDSLVRFGLRSGQSARVAAILVLSSVVTLINPYGLELHRAIFGLVSSDYFMGLNSEWQSPNFHNPAFWPFAALLFLYITAPKGDGELLPFEKIVFATFVLLGLSGSRYVPFLAVAAATPLTISIQGYFSLLRRFRSFAPASAFIEPAAPVRFTVGAPTAALGVIFLAMTVITGTIPGWKTENVSIQEKFPTEVVSLIQAAPAGTKVFMTPNWGGYFTWSIWPAQRAWIDDRNELNGKDLYEDFFTIVRLRKEWRETIDRHAFDLLLLEPDTAIYTRIQSDPAWRARFENEKAGLFERVQPAAP